MAKLTELKINGLKSKTKKYTEPDGGGLVLEIMPNGSKRWRYRYRFEGSAKMLSLGIYPDVGLKSAREAHIEARKQLANGINPSDARKASKVTNGGEDCLEVIAKEWHSKSLSKWSNTYSNLINLLPKVPQDCS